MMTLKEALSQAGSYCDVVWLGTYHTVNLYKEDIEKYCLYETEIEEQPYTKARYYTLHAVYNRSICKDFVNTLKLHQKGIWNGKTLEQIADIFEDLPLSEIKFYITSCIAFGLLEPQGDLYAW